MKHFEWANSVLSSRDGEDPLPSPRYNRKADGRRRVKRESSNKEIDGKKDLWKKKEILIYDVEN